MGKLVLHPLHPYLKGEPVCACGMRILAGEAITLVQEGKKIFVVHEECAAFRDEGIDI